MMKRVMVPDWMVPPIRQGQRSTRWGLSTTDGTVIADLETWYAARDAVGTHAVLWVPSAP